VLARLHAVAPDDEQLRRDAPWVLSLHRPPLDALRYLSAASIELIKVIQRDERFARGLDELRDGWRVEALVHRDVKWANCVAHAPAAGARRTAIALVDWEMAGWGDPALDVGSAFGELIGHRLDAVGAQPATAALWRAYVRGRRLDGDAAARLLDRAVRHAAARLVQSAYEDTQEAGLTTARVARSLQLAREILSAPRAATTDLLGIAA
jgi:thiamine kinase-like enzyme